MQPPPLKTQHWAAEMGVSCLASSKRNPQAVKQPGGVRKQSCPVGPHPYAVPSPDCPPGLVASWHLAHLIQLHQQPVFGFGHCQKAQGRAPCDCPALETREVGWGEQLEGGREIKPERPQDPLGGNTQGMKG